MILKKKNKKNDFNIVYGDNPEFIITKINIGSSNAYVSKDGIIFNYYILDDNGNPKEIYEGGNKSIFGIYQYLNYTAEIHEIKYIGKINLIFPVKISSNMDEKTKRISFKI